VSCFDISHLTAKLLRPFTGGDFVKNYLLASQSSVTQTAQKSLILSVWTK